MKITDVAFIGYPVSDIERARTFYENLLGLKVGEFDHEIEGAPGKYWIEYESIAFEVENFEEAVSKLQSAGVIFIAEHLESNFCDFALILDPDGNTITIHKRKSECLHRI
jgi:catechol 2,3-dioxygenase-like lactoylglutathione lyase family enzyme